MIKIPGKALAEALATVGKVVERRITIPILTSVKLATDGGKLLLSATNMDIWIDLAIDAEGEIAPICAPADKLRAVAIAAGSDPVEIDLRPSRLAIRYGSGRALLDVLPAVDFPTCEALPEGRSSFAVEAAELARAIAMVGPSMSTEATRMWLNGASLQRNRSGFRLAATDGHRLDRTQLETAEAGAGFPDDGVIIPRQTLALLAGLTGRVTIETDGQRLRASTDGMSIVSCLVEGRYPDIDSVIPRADKISAAFNAPDLLAAVERVVWATGDKERSIGVRFAPERGIVWTISGVAEATFGCEAEAETDIGFNAGYLAGLLSRLGEAEVQICGSSRSPALFVAAAADDHVIMPMRMEAYQPNKEMIDG